MCVLIIQEKKYETVQKARTFDHPLPINNDNNKHKPFPNMVAKKNGQLCNVSLGVVFVSNK